VASIPPNLESKLGATSPPHLASGSPHFWTQVPPPIWAFFLSLGGSFVKGVNCPVKNRAGIVKGVDCPTGEKLPPFFTGCKLRPPGTGIEATAITSPVIFNRGSVEPKGSASICQGFRGCMVSKQ